MSGNEQHNIKIGIAPINWSNDDDPSLGGEIDVHTCLSQMHAAGYEGTELGHKYPTDAKVLLTLVESHHLVVSSAWFSTFFTQPDCYTQTLQAFMHRLSLLKSVGARVINVCECAQGIQQQDVSVFGTKKPIFNEKQWAHLIHGLHAMGRLAKDYGMQLAYHYHLGTGVQNKDEIDYLMQHTSPELIGLLLDTGHAHAAGVDCMQLITNYGDRINQVHLKDVRDEVLSMCHSKSLTFMQAVREGLFTVPGDGNVNFLPIFSELKRLSYRGWWVVEAEQDPAHANPFEYAKLARSFIKQHAGV